MNVFWCIVTMHEWFEKIKNNINNNSNYKSKIYTLTHIYHFTNSDRNRSLENGK